MELEKNLQSSTMIKEVEFSDIESVNDSDWIMADEAKSNYHAPGAIIEQIDNMSLGEEVLDRWEIAKDVASILEEEEKETEPQKVIEARMKKFFMNDHLFKVPEGKFKTKVGEIKRWPVNYEAAGLTIEDCKVTIFGADYLSNQELKRFFQGKAKKTKWIDQSSVVVEFNSNEELKESLRKNLKEPLPEGAEISTKKEYELVINHNVQVRKLIARYTVSEDYQHIKPVNPKAETDEYCKDIFLEKEYRRRVSLLPRKKFIKKDQERRYEPRTNMTFNQENSRLSFSRNQQQEVSQSVEYEEEEIKKQGTNELDPINLDFDDISVIQDESQPKIPKIYLEANDGARFRTMNHKTRFRQPAPTRTSFCYKKYYEDQQKEEQVPKVAVIMLDDEAA